MRLDLSLSRQAENYLMRQPVNLQRRINERLEEIAVDEASKAKTLRVAKASCLLELAASGFCTSSIDRTESSRC